MRYGSGNKFDLSDVDQPVDTVDSVIDLAVEVLEDYGGECRTRIARMARWIVLNLAGDGAVPHIPIPPLGRDYSFSSRRLVSFGEEHVAGYSPDDARLLAKMILREVEYAESE